MSVAAGLSAAGLFILSGQLYERLHSREFGNMGGLWGRMRALPPIALVFVAASLGWMLDAFDVMLYALVLATLMQDLSMSKATAGVLGSVTLVASAVGGIVFGVVADTHLGSKHYRPYVLADLGRLRSLVDGEIGRLPRVTGGSGR